MAAFRVEPQALAAAGVSVAGTAARTAGAATALRSALSAIGSAAAHPGVESAAEEAGSRWRQAVQNWALGADDVATALTRAAAMYEQVDAAQMRELP